MLVTSLQPVIGYDKASEVAKLAHRHGITLKAAAMQLHVLSEEEYDSCIRPDKMINPRPLLRR